MESTLAAAKQEGNPRLSFRVPRISLTDFRINACKLKTKPGASAIPGIVERHKFLLYDTILGITDF